MEIDNIILYKFLNIVALITQNKEYILNNSHILEMINPLKKAVIKIHTDINDDEANIFSFSLFCLLLKLTMNPTSLTNYNSEKNYDLLYENTFNIIKNN